MSENPSNQDLKSLIEIAKNPDTPIRVLRNLAENPDTPPEVLTILSNSIYLIIGMCVADNPNTPADVLETLSDHKEYSIRKYVAQNPNTPLNVLETLSDDEDSDVRFYVAWNPNTPDHVLKNLSTDENSEVRNAVVGSFASRGLSSIKNNVKKIFNKFIGFNKSNSVSSSPKTQLNELESLETTTPDEVNSANTFAKQLLSITGDSLKSISGSLDILSKFKTNERIKKEQEEFKEEEERGEKNFTEESEKDNNNNQKHNNDNDNNNKPSNNNEDISALKGITKSLKSNLKTFSDIKNIAKNISNPVINALLVTFGDILQNNIIPMSLLLSKYISTKLLNPKNVNNENEDNEENEENEENEDSEENENSDKKKKKKGKGSILDKPIEMFSDFVTPLIILILQYSVLSWIADPKNKDSVHNLIKFLIGLFHVTTAVIGFGINSILDGIYNIIDGSKIEKLFGFIQVLAGFLAIRYLNPFKLIGDIRFILKNKTIIQKSFKTFIDTLGEGIIPAVIKVLKLFPATEKIFKNVVTDILSSIAKKITKFIAGKIGDAAVASFKNTVKGVGKSIKGIPVIGTLLGFVIDIALGDPVDKAIIKSAASALGSWIGFIVGGFVGAGAGALPGSIIGGLAFDFVADLLYDTFLKKEPVKLAKGGIVTKPTKAIIGEDGPEAVIPLKEFNPGGIIDSKFTEPFKIVGSAILGTMFDVMTGFKPNGISLIPLLKTILAPSIKMFGIESIPTLEIQKNKETINIPNTKIENKKDNTEEKEIIGEEKVNVLETDSSDENYVPRKNKSNSVRSLLGDILNNIIQLDFTSGFFPTENSNDNGGFNNGGADSGPYKQMLDLIAGPESSGHGYYEAFNRGGTDNGHTPIRPGNSTEETIGNESQPIPLTQRTVGDIMKLQEEGKLHATGRYQIIPDTLKRLIENGYGQTGVTKENLYDASTQDKLAITLINNRLKQGGNDPEKLRQAFREEWIGLKKEKVSDKKLDAAIQSAKAAYAGNTNITPQPKLIQNNTSKSYTMEQMKPTNIGNIFNRINKTPIQRSGRPGVTLPQSSTNNSQTSTLNSRTIAPNLQRTSANTIHNGGSEYAKYYGSTGISSFNLILNTIQLNNNKNSIIITSIPLKTENNNNFIRRV